MIKQGSRVRERAYHGRNFGTVISAAGKGCGRWIVQWDGACLPHYLEWDEEELEEVT